MSYDDLHFSSSSSSSSSAPVVRKVCLQCVRVVEGVSERLCPSCGSSLRPANTPEQQRALLELQQRSSGSGGVIGGGGGGGGAFPLTSDIENPMMLLTNLLERLGRGVGGIGRGGGEALLGPLFTEGADGSMSDGTERPAAKASVDALVRLTVRDPSIDLPRSFGLRLFPQGGEILAIPASFGAQLPAGSAISGRLVFAEPRDGSTDLINANNIKDSIAVFDRGVVSFAVKAIKAEAAGAIGVVVVNSKNCAWPYVMADSSGAGKNLRIPLVMVRHDEKLQCSKAELMASSSSDGCPVCCESFDAAGGPVVLMPCQHPFHERCLLPWLEKRHTCPLCRTALPEEPLTTSSSIGGFMREMEQARILERDREEQVNRDWFQ